MIEVQQISKRFGDVQAVEGLSFTANDGDITTLLGANGSGKSTTLRAICGVMQVDQGSVLIDGMNIKDALLKCRRSLGVFSDQFGLYPRLTAQEHLEYFGGFHGLRGASLRTAVQRVSALLDMDELLNRRTEGFSQGQRMKVALARTLIHQPKNLILDEPTRGLDVMSTRLLREVLKQLQQQGCCVLFSSHVMAEVEILSDQVLVISGGRLLTQGTVAKLIDDTKAPNLEEAFMSFVDANAA